MNNWLVVFSILHKFTLNRFLDAESGADERDDDDDEPDEPEHEGLVLVGNAPETLDAGRRAELRHLRPDNS